MKLLLALEALQAEIPFYLSYERNLPNAWRFCVCAKADQGFIMIKDTCFSATFKGPEQCPQASYQGGYRWNGFLTGKIITKMVNLSN